MNPRLIVIAGYSPGTAFDVPEGEVSIGREAANSIYISDPSVSRQHCLIRRVTEELTITDLESFNGTFVNGVPVKERTLEHGDQIKLGNVVLLLLLHEAQTDAGTEPVCLEEGALTAGSTIRLEQDDAFYLHPEKMPPAHPAARAVRDLGALLKIGADISSTQGAEQIQRRLLESLLEVVPAERGAVLLFDRTARSPSTVGLSRAANQAHPVRVSRTVTEQVLREGCAIMSNDVYASDGLSGAESLVASHTRSLICVPLAAFGQTLGAIYLDTSNAAVQFDEGHLQMLTAAAGIAAVALENARQREWLEGENERLHREIEIEHRMIGESRAMREVYQFIARVAQVDSTVLIRGESGTGKELAARAIHANSPRAKKNFIAINCATLTEPLLESELFGHERGAFTSAVAQKQGKLEVASGGTLFLDEVGELTAPVQAKLLRVLQEREFERVGGTRTIKADVRVVAATNKDLEAAARNGSFRQDLYYRLDVLSVTMPPLRQRREDISLLASYFAARCGERAKRRVMGVSPEARGYLLSYGWPGNVRELENVIERAVVLGSTPLILPEDLPDYVLEAAAPQQDGSPLMKFYEAVRETKKRLILDALEQTGGNYTEAARLLGVHPNNLHPLARNLGLKTQS
jgi:transcriptional regulator with GAF, ATPase, and Fis domain